MHKDKIETNPRTIVLRRISEERDRQLKKWGPQSDNTPFEWMSILGEEYGELCEAVNETFFANATKTSRGGPEAILKEAVQVAAVAAAIAETIIRVREEGVQ